MNEEKKQYTLIPTPKFLKQMKKLDKFTRQQIRGYMEKVVADYGEPWSKGKGLSANHAGEWRYRVGDYRVIVEIQENNLVVLALEVGHRRKVY